MESILNNKKLIVLFSFIVLISSCITKTKNDEIFGVVTAATPEASIAGEQIFLRGGNAIDVAVAVSFALGVTEPAMSGLGGGTQVLLSIKNLPPISINGTTLSPASTPTHIKDTLTYHRRSTIPSTVKVLDYIWRKYGSGKISWEELLKPAIELAEKGFSLGEFRAKVYEQSKNKLLESHFNTSFFLSNGRNIPKTGDIIKQPQLAKTLKRLAAYGANDFYNGIIAKEIAQDMKMNGGWITLNDLQNFPAPKELTPLSINYNGFEVYSQPPPCGGWTTLLILNLLEQITNNKVISDEDIIKALYLVHNDRENKPITNLLHYDSIVNIKLSNEYADKLLQEKAFFDMKKEEEGSGETTHFSVVDSEGNAIAVTSSINAFFGGLAASKELGFLYNTYMDDFIFEDPDHPFAIRPNAMAYSSMSPTIVQEKGENVLVIGSPGSSRIISSVAQITAKWIENRNINKLIKTPRIHVSKNYIYMESKKDTGLIDLDFIKNFDLKFKIPNENLMNNNLNPYYGGIHAIAKEHKIWVGVADPRRDGKVNVTYKN